jgi:hypothetical protein
MCLSMPKHIHESFLNCPQIPDYSAGTSCLYVEGILFPANKGITAGLEDSIHVILTLIVIRLIVRIII